MTGTEPLEAAPEADLPDAAEPAPAAAAPKEWWRHDNGRWIVGDAGSQPAVVATPALLTPGRPDTVVDGGQVADLHYRAVSLRGLGHQESGKPRQDAYVARVTRDGRWLVGCVADGVSEAKHSHRAADLVCQEVVGRLSDALADADDSADRLDVLHRLPWQETVDQASGLVVQEARTKARSIFEKRGDEAAVADLDRREFTHADARTMMSSTAVAFVVATAPDAHGDFATAVTVAAGDSSALRLHDGQWHPLTAVKGAGQEIASSAVRPLPRTVEVEPVIGSLLAGDLLTVVTDGIGDPMGAGTGVVGRFFAEQWRRPPDLLAFAQQVAFYRKSFVDDRTAVVVWTGISST